MAKELTIDDVRRVVHLLKRANQAGHVSLAETAKELKVSKTDLMAFIERHEPLFWLLAVLNPKGKNPGLFIKDVYTDASDNPIRPEFVAALKEKWKDTIHVDGYYEYEFRGWYISEDTQSGQPKDDNRLNHFLWRNTKEKMERIVASGHCRPGYYWGGGDGRSQIHFDHCVTGDDLKALEAEGWTIEGDPTKH